MQSRVTQYMASVAVGLAVGSIAFGQYHGTPDWKSSDRQVSTGGAWADINGDGYLDFVVANGNDISRQRVVVYYNNGDGTLPGNPNWQSTDTKYNGHLDIADVNGDGWLDVAVAHLLNEGGPAAKIYMNHDGTLETTASWTTGENEAAFGCAFGDVNNDGRPDLAVATGWPYDGVHNSHNYVHLNVNGTLEKNPSWVSDDIYDYSNALWVDADDDGWLDLLCVGNNTNNWIYRNLGGVLETTASWGTMDRSAQFAIMATAGDVNGDGIQDLFVTDNTQLFGGAGRFRQYDGLPAPDLFETNFSWNYYDGYGSAIALVDVNGDGHLDLATGAWWDYTRLFLNNAGAGLPSNPSWNSGSTSVVEKIVFADVNPDCGIVPVYTQRFHADGSGRQLFSLPHKQIQGILSVRMDGIALDPTDYTYNREQGWLTVFDSPLEVLDVTYKYSASQDMGVTNWDSSLSNYLYYNQNIVDCNGNGQPDGCDIFNGISRDTNSNGIPDECEKVYQINPHLRVTPKGAQKIGW